MKNKEVEEERFFVSIEKQKYLFRMMMMLSFEEG
jgi:hypothetical protein